MIEEFDAPNVEMVIDQTNNDFLEDMRMMISNKNFEHSDGIRSLQKRVEEPNYQKLIQ